MEETADWELPLPPIATIIKGNEEEMPHQAHPPMAPVEVKDVLVPLLEDLTTWHLSQNFKQTLDRLISHTTKELEKNHFYDYVIDIEEVGQILSNLMGSSKLVYFTKRSPYVHSIKTWAKSQFEARKKWPIKQVWLLFQLAKHREAALKASPSFMYQHFVLMALWNLDLFHFLGE